MDRALELAAGARGWCSPNPAVGAVLVRDGRVVGEGRTQPPGNAHAEIMALRAAGPRARGATLFVTLEPCSHYGRTPPCAEAIIAAGVHEVYAAMLDPSPWVSGQGVAALLAAGIAVSIGEREADARQLNEAYLKWVATRLPFVTLKYAMTADGKSATRTGSSFWVSGPEARQEVARLRAAVDAVLVGVDTVIADDPQLTARPDTFGGRPSPSPPSPVEGEAVAPEPVHQPLRVVLDSRGRTPATARLVTGGLPGDSLIITTRLAPPSFQAVIARPGVEVLVVGEREGHVDVREALRVLGERGIIAVLAECGGRLAAALLTEGSVDKIVAFVAPKLVGGATAPTPVEGVGLPLMDQAIDLRDPIWTVVGRDVMLTAAVGVDSSPLAMAANAAASPAVGVR